MSDSRRIASDFILCTINILIILLAIYVHRRVIKQLPRMKKTSVYLCTVLITCNLRKIHIFFSSVTHFSLRNKLRFGRLHHKIQLVQFLSHCSLLYSLQSIRLHAHCRLPSSPFVLVFGKFFFRR